MSSRRPGTTGATVLLGALLYFAASPLQAAQLKKDTAAAYARYLAVSERRIAAEVQNGPFLYIDAWPEANRRQACDQLRQGTVLVEQVNTPEEGHPIAVPHGLIHDWQGLLFIPHATLDQVLAVMQNYPRYQNYFAPQIRNSRLLSHEGDEYKVSMQLYKKSLVTVAIDADFDVRFERIGADRETIRSYATRLAQVDNVDQPDARELAPDDGDGYLWRLCDFWRFEERDGGVYAQMESIGLSRGVPAWIAWAVNPLLRSIPRGTLTALLTATRRAVEHP